MRPIQQIRVGLLCGMLALHALTAAAQQGTTLTLSQAVTLALGNNPDKQIAKASVDAGHIGARMARTALLPNLSFAEGVTRGNDPVYVFGTKLRQQVFSQSDFAPNSLNRPTPINDFTTRFAGTWTAFDSWHTQLEIRRTDLEAKSAVALASRSDQEIILRTIQAYETILFAIRQVEVTQHGVETAKALLSSSQTRVTAGLTVDSDK